MSTIMPITVMAQVHNAVHAPAPTIVHPSAQVVYVATHVISIIMNIIMVVRQTVPRIAVHMATHVCSIRFANSAVVHHVERDIMFIITSVKQTVTQTAEDTVILAQHQKMAPRHVVNWDCASFHVAVAIMYTVKNVNWTVSRTAVLMATPAVLQNPVV